MKAAPTRRFEAPALLAALFLTLTVLHGCGPSIPTRFVLERDINDWSYRRYQRVLDVEIAVEGNVGVGHTATYVQRPGRLQRTVPFANVFVSVYENAQGLSAEVRRQVRALASYETEVRDFGGGHVWYLDAGPGDRWALWVSGNHIVKVGASDETEDVPEEIVSEYMSTYSSDLDEHGRARGGTPSAGELPDPAPASESNDGDGEGEGEGEGEEEEDVPHFLRDDAPR